MDTPKFPGIEVTLGGTAYVVPPLSLGQLRVLAPKMLKFAEPATTGDTSAERLGDIIAVVHAALHRNYPDLTPEAVGELLDLGTLQSVVSAVMVASGLDRGNGKPEQPAPQ